MSKPMNDKQWVPVVGWESSYEVSRDSTIRKTFNKVIISQSLTSNGYKGVRLSRPRKSVKVHRIVAMAFIPNPNNKPHVNHINNIRTDNRVENLEWCTNQENLLHARKQGRMINPPASGYGTGKIFSKEHIPKIINMRKEGKSHREIAEKFGCNRSVITNILSGKHYKDFSRDLLEPPTPKDD